MYLMIKQDIIGWAHNHSKSNVPSIIKMSETGEVRELTADDDFS